MATHIHLQSALNNAGRSQCGCSAQEIFSIFVGGGSLVIVPPGSEKDTQHMARMCKKHDVAACILVPSLLEALLRVRPMPPSCSGLLLHRLHCLANAGTAICRNRSSGSAHL